MVRNTIQPRAYHVLAGESGWEVRDDRTHRPLGWFEAREDAIAVARDAVQAEENAQLVVHNPDGSVASQWPSDEAIALNTVEVFDAGELAAEILEADDSFPEDLDAVPAQPSDEDDGDLE